MKVIMAGGGTGGHIFPAIAIAGALRDINPNADILFIGAKGKLDEQVVPKYNYKLETIEIYGFNKREVLKTLILPFKFFSAVAKCKKIMRYFTPDIVVATGGFVSAPVIYSAIKLNTPFILQEGNAFPGKVTRYFSDKAKKVIINFEDTIRYLKANNNIIRIAHPVRNYNRRIDKIDIVKKIGINPDYKTLFIFGGSQGSRSINNAIIKNLDDLYNLRINIIWQTGKIDYENLKKVVQNYNDRIKIYDFIDNINEIYIVSDLVLCRAGITSVMELSLFGKPSILVPYPYAAENHQEKNAKVLERENACIVLKDEDLTNKLFSIIKNLIMDEKRLYDMSLNAKKIADEDAAKKIALEIIKSLKNE
ncbi:MAG: undecaprenyldiphospho-muramoylpentapeptide beta-N-acetylglucosaminyltransferase [Ignavibacteria bacterium]|nr:undecaprenyldiphospho-muramoylpentapeptide beta-N-acetylglucosaminyltransferase [Ignavibacteria bacterium]